MKYMLLWAGLATLTVAQPAAASWVHFADCGSAGSERTYWYDNKLVSAQGTQKVVRIRGDYSRVAGSRIAKADIVWTMDCSTRTFVERQRTERGKNGKVLSRYSKPTRPMRAQGESVAAKLATQLCG